MNILVTGAAGFIGYHLSRELGWESRVTQEEAMNRMKTWVENTYIQRRA
jgi:thioester reductase-like protein